MIFFTVPVNLAGICAISQPCGTDEQGLPIGLQWIGPALGEETILRAAAAFEASGENRCQLAGIGRLFLMSTVYTASIGLEIHVQLKTQSKNMVWLS